MLNKGDLVVSCQALEDEPLHSSFIMSRMALAAKQGGAKAIRANSAVDIKAIKEIVDLPIIGIVKKMYKGSDIHITVTMQEVDELVAVNTDIIALDATKRLRPNQQSLSDFVKEIRTKYPNQKLMADCSTIDEMRTAEQLGFEYIGTTLFGYTEYSKKPALAENGKLMREACDKINVPIIAEGNVNTPSLAKLAMEIGCYCVVVGSMITRPQIITSKFAQQLESVTS